MDERFEPFPTTDSTDLAPFIAALDEISRMIALQSAVNATLDRLDQIEAFR